MTNLTISVNINAPELSNAITALATALVGSVPKVANTPTLFSAPVQPKDEPEPQQTPEPEPAPEPKPAPAPTVSLEEVRAKLAALSQSGKQAQVKELITKFGAQKLTEIPAEKYGELLAQAEELA